LNIILSGKPQAFFPTQLRSARFADFTSAEFLLIFFLNQEAYRIFETDYNVMQKNCLKHFHLIISHFEVNLHGIFYFNFWVQP